MTLLGPRTVTVAYDGGPADGIHRDHPRDDTPMPEHLGGAVLEDQRYRRDRLDPITDIWHYRWDPPRTGLRNPCRAGGDDGCPGARCPSGRPHRQHQHQ